MLAEDDGNSELMQSAHTSYSTAFKHLTLALQADPEYDYTKASQKDKLREEVTYLAGKAASRKGVASAAQIEIINNHLLVLIRN